MNFNLESIYDIFKTFVLQVLKLHTKLGKPIPSTEPTVVASNNSTIASAGRPVVASANKAVKAASATVVTSVGGTKKILATPKITFVGGTQLKTTGNKTEEVKTESRQIIPSAAPTAIVEEDDGMR